MDEDEDLEIDQNQFLEGMRRAFCSTLEEKIKLCFEM